LILSNVTEDGDDDTFLQNMSTIIKSKSQPQGATRIGRKIESRPRLMKITFPTEFDARTFRSRFEEARQQSDNPKKMRMRPSRTH
jgi:hypothetical protein